MRLSWHVFAFSPQVFSLYRDIKQIIALLSAPLLSKYVEKHGIMKQTAKVHVKSPLHRKRRLRRSFDKQSRFYHLDKGTSSESHWLPDEKVSQLARVLREALLD